MMGEVEGLICLFRVLATLQLKPWSAREASHYPIFLSNYYSHVFSLIHPVDEFSSKEMSTWGQFKISSGCTCVWCKSKELGGRMSAKLPAPMVERLSAEWNLETKLCSIIPGK